MHCKPISRAIQSAFAFGLLYALLCGTTHAAGVQTTVSADDALRLLTAGNERFASGKPERPNTGLDRVHATAGGQAPFAAVLACADSRVPVETVFDRGVGDLFVVRVAGNVADPGTLGSMEYAAEHLHTHLIVVMGHTQCGAVKAAIGGGELTGNLPSLIDRIRPAVRTVRAREPADKGEKLLTDSILQNVHQQIADAVAKSELLRQMVHDGKVKIVGAVYKIETGRVEWLDDSAPQATKK